MSNPLGILLRQTLNAYENNENNENKKINPPPFKYDVEIEKDTPGHHNKNIFAIKIWNKWIDNKRPIVHVKIDNKGKETYSNINGNYPIKASSQKTFQHYSTLDKLLRDAKKNVKNNCVPII